MKPLRDSQRPNIIRSGLRHGAIVTAALAVAGFASLESLFAPKAELWERWATADVTSTTTVDHADWDALLATYVSAGADAVNRFAYTGISEPDRLKLAGYIERLQTITVTGLNADEQRAYWINLYNAATVNVVIQHLPVESIRDIDISPGLFADGPWEKKMLTVEGEEISLNDIEHRILRPIWKDARIHYAVNCASIGCPNLVKKAFSAATAEAMLDAAARAYVNHARGARKTEDGLVVSKIYAWFKDDFGGDDAGVLEHLKQYAAPDLKAVLDDAEGIFGHEYDWSLNGVRPPS